MELGVLETIDARTIWQNESLHFTPWLRENAHLLGRALGLEIDVEINREVEVGGFAADLQGTEIGSQATLLIENQLESTDHSHLGQLLTYAGGLDAHILIWVSTKVRDEHRQALTWLNEVTRDGISFFAVEIELLRIEDSKPAPHFKVVVAPNEYLKARQSAAAVSSELGNRYRDFWRTLLAEITIRDRNATTASPERVPAQNYWGIGIGKTGFQDNFTFSSDGIARVHLYIDTGDETRNKAIFDLLVADREQIEEEFGEPLNWHRREDIRASIISTDRKGSPYDPADALTELAAWGAERMLRLRQVFGPRVRALEIPLGGPFQDTATPLLGVEAPSQVTIDTRSPENNEAR